MALREYRWRGGTYQFEESQAPAAAVPVEGRAASIAAAKESKPQNKARAGRTKKA